MALKSLRRFFPSLKFFSTEVIRRNLITLINVSVTVVLIATVITVLLFRASNMQRRTVEESVVNLAAQTAMEVKSYYLTNFDVTRTMSQIMKNYQTIEVTRRRAFLIDAMLGILTSNPALISLYTIWKPNALDGMDEYYANIELRSRALEGMMDPLFANAEVTDETGQFITGFTRERGWVEQRTFGEFRYLLDAHYFTWDITMNEIINDPVYRLQGESWGEREMLVVDIQIPILYNLEVVGVMGATINLNYLQYLIVTRRPLGTGRSMICSNVGTIIAHSEPGLRGINLLNQNDRDPLMSYGIADQVFRTMSESIAESAPRFLTTKDMMVISYPLRAINPMMPSSAVDQTGPSWAVITSVPLSTIAAPIRDLLRFSVLFIIGATVLMVFVVFATSRSLTQQTKALQRDLEQASTMQDNLKYGLFLMDSKYNMQGAYSKALEKILSVANLKGKNFLELLSSSIKQQERDGLGDYFDMILKKSFDKELLDSVNPIVEFTYVNPEAAEIKNLRTTFTLAERGRGGDYILGTVEDITSEKELKKQLLEAENIRENEMRSLFQVIQLDPRVLSDFVADAEYEFERINDMLKSKRQLHKDLLVDIFQAVHAVKSNAIILNLETFSERLHKLENSVKSLQDRSENEILLDDFIELMFELDEAMKEIDSLKATVSKIENFRSVSGGGKSQERYVLVETLSRVCQKTQAALNKKVRLVVEDIDESVLNSGPRRAIKEVLTQLVRNAVYHGIETPEERMQLGKEPEGEIQLSIRHRNDQVFIKLTDNGNGIDFEKIQKKAAANRRFSNPAEATDKNLLLKAIFSPGFSTLEGADFHAGRGIGLSLVKDRVREMHGNITVATANGKGTTFTISLPMRLPAAIDKVS